MRIKKLFSNKTKTLLKNLDSCLFGLQFQFNYINSGGCGVIAEMVYDTLKNLGLKPTIVILARADEMPKEKIEENLKNNAGGLEVPFSHIVIRVNKKYIDSNGIQKDFKNSQFSKHILVEGMSIELLKQWNQTQEFWNDMFNRRQIPKIKKEFKHIENTLKLAIV